MSPNFYVLALLLKNLENNELAKVSVNILHFYFSLTLSILLTKKTVIMSNAVLKKLKQKQEEEENLQLIETKSSEKINEILSMDETITGLKSSMDLNNVENKSLSDILANVDNSFIKTRITPSDIGAVSSVTRSSNGLLKVDEVEILNAKLTDTQRSNNEIESLANIKIETVFGGNDAISNIKNGKKADGTYISKDNINLGKVENQTPDEILESITVDHIKNSGIQPSDIGAETPNGAQNKVDDRLTETEKVNIESDIINLQLRVRDVEESALQK